MSSRAHTSALLAYLRADPALAQIVFDGAVDGEAPKRYVLVFSQTMDHEVDRMAGRQRPLTARHTIHSIGQVPAEAQWLADKVSARLVGARIPVPGRVSSPVRHDGGDPLRVDMGGSSPAVYFLADDYSWVSTP